MNPVSMLLLLLSLIAPVASLGAESDEQAWGQLVSQGKVLGESRPEWQLFAEAQGRLSDASRGVSTIILRTAIGYLPSPDLSIWAGIGWMPSIEPLFRNESRIWQQAIWTLKPGEWTFTQRLRVEERIIERTDRMALRGRYMLRVLRSVVDGSDWKGLVQDEIFFNANSVRSGPQSGFDQNRAFIGVNKGLSDSLRFDLGYLHNRVNRPSPAQDRVNHVAMLTFYHFW